MWKWLVRLTAEVVIALSSRRPKRIWILAETIPFIGVVLPRLIWSEPIPDPWVDFRHLRFFHNFHFQW
jgi:hypothetical protein